MPKYVHVKTDKMDRLVAAPFVIEADTAEVVANELVVRLGDLWGAGDPVAGLHPPRSTAEKPEGLLRRSP